MKFPNTTEYECRNHIMNSDCTNKKATPKKEDIVLKNTTGIATKCPHFNHFLKIFLQFSQRYEIC